MKKKQLISLLLLTLIIVVAYITDRTRLQEYKQAEIVMDTIVEISVQTPRKLDSQKIVQQAFDKIKEFEKKFSYYDSTSILFTINHTKKDTITIDHDFYTIFSVAREVYNNSDSLYDISIGNLVDIWDFENEMIPSISEIEKAKLNSGFDKIYFDNEILVKPEQYKIILGSIAKGYIIDQTVYFLQTRKVTNGIVNAGGDIRIFGKEKLTSIGIQHPRAERSKIIKTIHLPNLSIVTSGDYERFFIKDGLRYHHILNPKTGFPGDTMCSITVIHPSAMIADAYATALFLQPVNRAVEIAESVDNLEIILSYFENDEIVSLQTEGMEKVLKNEK